MWGQICTRLYYRCVLWRRTITCGGTTADLGHQLSDDFPVLQQISNQLSVYVTVQNFLNIKHKICETINEKMMILGRPKHALFWLYSIVSE